MPDETSPENYFTLSIIIGGEFPVCRQAGIWRLKNKLLSDETTMIKNLNSLEKDCFHGSSMSLKF